MSFPNLVPSSRSWDPGQFPVKAYAAQDGAEVRMLYGNKAFGAKMRLVYQNISNKNASAFGEHYLSVQGSYKTFDLSDGAKSEWSYAISPESNKWRYAEPPQLESGYPGFTTVTISLVSALNWS